MRYIGMIILLVFCLTLLLLTGCTVNTANSETTSGNLENQENTEESGIVHPQKWSGLGMGLFSTYNISEFNGDVDTLLANGFTQLRIHMPDYNDSNAVDILKTAVLSAIAKDVQVIWGVSSTLTVITSTNWADFRQAILDTATWAQANGVYEFQIGNEEEWHVDGTTMTVAQIIANLKSVATEVKQIFTNGNVSYSCFGANINDWITAGKGDIDILASNIYRGGEGYYDNGWKTLISNLVNAFGANGTYLTEFNLSWSSLDDYSTDEAVQATALTEMIEYIKASGMTRAFYFTWKDTREAHFGVVKTDGTYRLLWNQALLNTGPEESTTVPIKTTTISLPDTIALIPNNPDSTKPCIRLYCHVNLVIP
jgi:hypothetical protein